MPKQGEKGLCSGNLLAGPVENELLVKVKTKPVWPYGIVSYDITKVIAC
jgi:hypothetical protein